MKKEQPWSGSAPVFSVHDKVFPPVSTSYRDWRVYTEPQIGGAIAEAVLKRFNEKGTFGVITTHYQNLKHFAEDHEGVVNGAMLYDRHLMQALFQLQIGNPGSSFAVEIARKIGLPEDKP